MIYDKASDYLVIAAYTDSTMQQSAAMLYGISVADKTLAPLGTFGTGVWPVVGLYRADAASSGNSADAQPVNKTTGSVNAAKLTRTTREGHRQAAVGLRLWQHGRQRRDDRYADRGCGRDERQVHREV